ncbi:MAG: NADPH-dependent 7-cyano-7-deazaguanine reductase QueF [Rickettsiaceae bacterium]
MAIPRKIARDQIGLKSTMALPFVGVDIWNCYEVSWLNNKGKPEVRILQFAVPYGSDYIAESKSVKLYFNSFNGTRFSDEQKVLEIIQTDLSNITNSQVKVIIKRLDQVADGKLGLFNGTCLDSLDIQIDEYDVNPELLILDFDDEEAEEELYSNLLKSNCLVTNQPDWASVWIKYKGKKIDHASLLKYLVSFRNHSEFHEQCVEHIFCDIMQKCSPSELTVYAKYTRRGGIDINPYRTNTRYIDTDLDKSRDIRQ